jgi:5-methylcytosine-specific restriction enzyme A
MKRITGIRLNEKYNLGAVQARYRENGYWYHPLKNFPGALFDANGYVLFQTATDYQRCATVRKGPDPNHIHVPGGIASLPFYVRLVPAPINSGV